VAECRARQADSTPRSLASCRSSPPASSRSRSTGECSAARSRRRGIPLLECRERLAWRHRLPWSETQLTRTQHTTSAALDARPIRKGKLSKPTEFGSVTQITANTRRGARGLIPPAASLPGNPVENTLLPQTIAELDRLGLSLREVALVGAFTLGPTTDALSDLAPDRVFIAGRQQPGSRRTQRRLQRYRTGAAGCRSHLKRGYGLRAAA
jgi:hypothetical protein